MTNYFSNNLKYIREKRLISQNKLAKLINTSQTTIARWEDENRIPSIDKAIDVSIALNIPLNDLIGTDLRLNDVNGEKEEKDLLYLNSILKTNGFLNENESMTQKDFDNLFNFIKANKDFIIKRNNKED